MFRIRASVVLAIAMIPLAAVASGASGASGVSDAAGAHGATSGSGVAGAYGPTGAASAAGAASAGNIPEQEPNQPCGQGQTIQCGNLVAPAQLQPGDEDWYSFFGNQGEIVTVVTEPLNGGDNTNTFLELVADDCLGGLAQDDNSGNGNYAVIDGFILPYTGEFHVLVRGAGPADQGPYALALDCQPGPGGLSVDDALDILVNDFIPNSPFADSLLAYCYDPPGPDSTLAPGTTIADWDSSYVETIPSEVYFFWLDDEPEFEFTHHTTVVLVDKQSGFVQPFEGDGWPIIDGVPIFDFDPDNATDNGRCSGTPKNYPSLNVTYTPQDHNANTKTYAVIAVGKNLSAPGDEFNGEKKARTQDVKRVQNILNTLPLGPKVDKDKMKYAMGADTTGTTREELCTVLESLDEDCKKLHFYYLGHGSEEDEGAGTQGGMILKGEGDERDIVTWHSLAAKLSLTGIEEVCVVIEACHAGGAIAALRDFNITFSEFPDNPNVLKGKLITSSTPERKTYRNNCQGTPFIMGLYDCWQQSSADLNKADGVDAFEALAWALKQAENAPQNSNLWKLKASEPKGTTLGGGHGEPITFNEGTSCWKKPISKGGRKLTYEIKDVSYTIGSGTGEKVVRRKRVYVTNESSSVTKFTKPIQLGCIQGKTFTPLEIEGNPNDDKTKWKPRIGPGQRVCVADWPEGCTVFGVRKAPDDFAPDSPWDDPFSETLFALGGQGGESDSVIFTDGRTALYWPEEDIYQIHMVRGEIGDTYVTTVLDTLPTWDLTSSPDSFFVSTLIDSQEVTLRGEVPLGALGGGEIRSYVENIDDPEDRRQLTLRALLAEFVPTDITGPADLPYQALRVDGALRAEAGPITALRSNIEFIGQPSENRVGTGGAMGLVECLFSPEEGAAYTFEVQGDVDWNTVAFVEPLSGLQLSGASGLIRNGWVLGSLADGLLLSGDLAGLDLQYFDVDSSAAHGVTFDGVSNALLRDIRVTNSGLDDVSMAGASTAELRNACLDIEKVSVESGSELTLSYDTWVQALDVDGESLLGVLVEIRDAENTLVSSSVTDTAGGSNTAVLIRSIFDGPVRNDFTPHEVFVSLADWDSTFAYIADSSRVVPITLPFVAADVEPEEDEVREPKLIGKVPNPLVAGHPLEIRYAIPAGERIEVSLFDVQGRRLEKVGRYHTDGGEFSVELPSEGLPGGTYFYRISIGDVVTRRKITLLE